MTSLVTHPSLDSEPLQLNCLVLGDDPSHIFPVKIQRTESVGALKKAIKEENQHTFEDVDAKTLVLWNVSIPHDPKFEQTVNETKFDDDDALRPLLKLSTIFPVRPEEGNVHIVVDLPPLRTSIPAIEPGEVNDKLAAMVNSVYHIFRFMCH